MPSIIKAAGTRGADAVPFHLDDIGQRAGQHLEQARAEADRIIAAAHAEADAIRRDARDDGRAEGREQAAQAAERTVDEKIARQLDTLLPALRQAVDGIAHARHDWLAHWEQAGLRFSIAIAERIIRRELKKSPDITLELVKEALELTAGDGDLQVRLHPEDFAALGPQVKRLANEMGRTGRAQVVADARIDRGGCRVDSRFGSIDQQIEAQLARIAEELS